jgi:hypothetical protein
MFSIALLFSLVFQQTLPPRKPEAPKDLIEAAEKGDVQKLRGFFQHPAFAGVDGNGRTVLLAAAEKGQKAAFAEVISIANDRARKVAVRLPGEGQPAVGELMAAVRMRLSLFGAADDKGITPLMHAAREGWDDLARLLIEGGASIATLDGDSRSAADYAETAGYVELAATLRSPPK